METHFAVSRLTLSYVKAALQSTIYNNTHLEQSLTLCQVDLGLRRKEKENGRGYIFSLSFLQVYFPPFPRPLWNFPCVSAVSCSMVLDRCLHTRFQPLPSIPFFVQCITQVPHFFFEKATRIENGIMAHFPPKIWFKYIFTHFRGLWFKLEYILPRSWFSEGGSGGFHEAQICRKKIINAFSCCFKWFFFRYLAQNESAHCMKTAMDRQPLNTVADKEHFSKQGRRDLNGPVTVTLWVTVWWCYHPNKAIYVQDQTVPLSLHTIPLAVHQLLLEVP